MLVVLLGHQICLPPLWAAGAVIKAIEIEGNVSVSDAAITQQLVSQVGGRYQQATIEEDIRRLFRRGDFADIQVRRTSVPGGIKLIYQMTERPMITTILFTGNRRLKTKQLLEKIPVKPFHTLNGAELSAAIEAIQEAYKEKRYYLVDVDYTLEPTDEGSLLTFRIKEHGKAAVRRIQFVGNRVFRDRQLKKIIRSKEKGAFLFRTGKLQRDRLDQDVALLARHYLNHGFLQVQIERPRVEISKDKRHLFLTYTVQEGQKYKVSDVQIDGDILTTVEELRSLLTLEVGKTYRHERVEADIATLQRLYGTLGYAFANIQPIPIPDESMGTASVVYTIAKGRRVYIDKIHITGNSITRDKVIRRELKVKEGDLFNRQALEESRDRLMQLGYFEEVNFSTPRGSRENSVHLNIAVKEKPTGTFNIGAGYSTAESVFFTGSIAKENFFGRGISGQIAVEISKLRQQYMIQFSDPYFLDTSWILGLSSYRTVFRYPEFDRKAFGGSLSLGHRIFEHGSVSVGYSYEDVKASNFLFSVPEIFRTNASGRTSSASLTLGYDRRDNRIFPKKGVFASVTNEFSGSYLGGDNNFYRLNAQGRYYQPIVAGIIGKLYLKSGYIKSFENTSVPLFDRYLMGGPNSLRGFDIWTIGPALRIPASPTGGDTNFVYGGNKMIQANLELEFPLYDPAGFRAVAFIDAGNAFAEEQAISFKQLRTNYGFGLRWISPLGPLRFEWGFPFKRRPGEAKTVFNFTIGDFF